MKKLLVLAALAAFPYLSLADTTNMPKVVAPVLLSRLAVAINTAAPCPWSLVRVHQGGMVSGKVCKVAVVPTEPPKFGLKCDELKPSAIEAKQYARVLDLMKDATRGVMKSNAGKAVCAALSTEIITYRSAYDRRVLWTGASPCGANVHYNDSASASELKLMLDNFLVAQD